MQFSWMRDARLFGRDTIHIEHGYRCNFKCSYCTVQAGPERPRSYVEGNAGRLIEFLGHAPPAIICVTGGEPLVWKELGEIVAKTPQHYWIIWSNLSGIAGWILLDNVILIIATYHHGQVSPEKYLANLRHLRDVKRRAFAKFIARPGEDFAETALWRRSQDEGTPAAFTPFEDLSVRYSHEWLHAICTTYLVSAMYTARFFKRGTALRLCRGGTRSSYLLNQDGTIGRCAHVSTLMNFNADGPTEARPSSLEAPNFFEKPAPCLPVHGCYCEPHHFSLMAKAGENRRWENYIKKGVWQNPSRRELIAFVRKEKWDDQALQAALRPPQLPRDSKAYLSSQAVG